MLSARQTISSVCILSYFMRICRAGEFTFAYGAKLFVLLKLMVISLVKHTLYRRDLLGLCPMNTSTYILNEVSHTASWIFVFVFIIIIIIIIYSICPYGSKRQTLKHGKFFF